MTNFNDRYLAALECLLNFAIVIRKVSIIAFNSLLMEIHFAKDIICIICLLLYTEKTEKIKPISFLIYINLY